MKTFFGLTILAVGLLLNTSASAVDKSQIPPASDISPMEKHPECMERTVAAQSNKCLEHDVGTPRHKRPPKAPASAAPATPPVKPQPKGP